MPGFFLRLLAFFFFFMVALLQDAVAEPAYPVVSPWMQDNAYPMQGLSLEREQRVLSYSQVSPAPSESASSKSVDELVWGDSPPPVRAASADLKPEAQKPSSEDREFSLSERRDVSMLEAMYEERIHESIFQFGYDMFGSDVRAMPENNIVPMGAVQDDFVLHSGDEVRVVFTGQRADQQVYKVDSQGLLLISDFPPIQAAGRSIGEVKAAIAATAGELHNTQAFVSLESVRQVGVLVVGHVKVPGRKSLSVFHTVLDALMASGGVDKTGSLRRIKLVRTGSGREIDLYDLLMDGGTDTDLRLRDGDRIIVPPIGPTVAISGFVKRPGIYEITGSQPAKESEKLSLDDLLALAGGVLVPGQSRYLKLGLTPDGREDVEEIQNPLMKQFGDGSVLMVSKGDDMRTGMVELAGHTRKAGLYDLTLHRTLQDLLVSEQVLGADIYPLIGVIERWDADQLSTQFLNFPVRLVLKKEYDQELQEGDRLYLFSKADISKLFGEKKNEKSRLENRSNKSEISQNDTRFINDISVSDNLRSYLAERAISVNGAVRNPGLYPVADGTNLDSLLATAGGVTLEGDTRNIEVTTDVAGGFGDDKNGPQGRRGSTHRIVVDFEDTRPEDVFLYAGDSVRVNQIPYKSETKDVLILGEVLHPGRYDLLPGDRLSDLMKRAGGLTRQAYAAGAIFSRESERKAEEARFRAAGLEMERALAAAIQRSEKEPPDAGQIEMVRGLAAQLASAEGVGRITVEADPAVLSVEPELDMLLEPGDRVYILKRPLTVRVNGEVLSPANLQFRKDKDPIDYIDEAGGFTYHADKDRTFVLYPDGSAQPLQVSHWNHKALLIPPGSTIYVPRDPKPFDFIESARDVSQILSNLAITSIFVDDIKD